MSDVVFGLPQDDERAARLREAVAEAQRRYDAMTPEQQAAMWEAQRQSWIRAFAPCEHGDPDWETCPECLAGHEARKTGDVR